jgi:hypothetical protein
MFPRRLAAGLVLAVTFLLAGCCHTCQRPPSTISTIPPNPCCNNRPPVVTGAPVQTVPGPNPNFVPAQPVPAQPFTPAP